ncbi:MAG: hypothetical protein ACYDBJ_07985 [Aggregatilineales bacterium]
MPPPGLFAGALLPLDAPELDPSGEVGRCGLEDEDPPGDEPDDSDDEPPPNGPVGRGAFDPGLDDELPPNGFGRGAFDPEFGGGLLAGRPN